jgi:hypothetical protein
VAVTIAAIVGQDWLSTLNTDVYHAHRAGGAALIAGENPYSDAVSFLDGSPFAPPDRVISGYPYTPIVLSTFGLAGAFTDPRLISLVCWLAFVGWLAYRASVERAESGLISLSPSCWSCHWRRLEPRSFSWPGPSLSRSYCSSQHH